MEINNKYNVNDRVFVYSEGYIIHAKVTRIEVIITNEISFTYYLEGDSEQANDKLDYSYGEEELSPTLEDIINHIEVL